MLVPVVVCPVSARLTLGAPCSVSGLGTVAVGILGVGISGVPIASGE